jgi:hypothetical protein
MSLSLLLRWVVIRKYLEHLQRKELWWRLTGSRDRCWGEELERLVRVRLNRLEGILGFEIEGEAAGVSRVSGTAARETVRDI